MRLLYATTPIMSNVSIAEFLGSILAIGPADAIGPSRKYEYLG